MEKIKVYKYHYSKWLPNGFITEPNTETKSKTKSKTKSNETLKTTKENPQINS